MKNNILVLGGDKRQLYLAKKMKNKGFNVEIYGFSDVTSKFNVSESLKEGMQKNDVVILPMPVTKNNVSLNAPLNDFYISLEEIYSNINENHFFFGGLFNEDFCKKTKKIYDYGKNEALLLKNAFLTAEATLEIIISSTPYSIFCSDVLILGYGRIGKALSEILKNLGANVTACMRKETDFAMCDLKNISTMEYKFLKEKIKNYKTIVNTVPSIVIDVETAKNISKDAIVIDVSSKEGGCDYNALKNNNIKYIHALGLPGKVSPETSGNIIFEIILKQLERD